MQALHRSLLRRNGAGDRWPVFEPARSIISSHPILGTKLLAIFIPSIPFKELSQFDFVKNNGVLVPSSFLDRPLSQVTFRWDLKKIISSPAARLEAAAALKPDPPEKTPATPAKLCVLFFGTGRSVISVDPEFAINACVDAGKKLAADSYALGCVGKEAIAVSDQKPLHEQIPLEQAECWRPSRADKQFPILRAEAP